MGGAISFHPFKGGHEKFYSVSREDAKSFEPSIFSREDVKSFEPSIFLFVALPPHN